MTRLAITPALVLALLVAVACGEGEAPGGTFMIHDARIEPSPTGQGPAGGFLMLMNATDRPFVLIGASSPAAARVELHRSWIEAGVARMAPVAELPIPPGDQVTLEPGGYHLMLFDAPGLVPGGELVLRLEFAGGESREVTARVGSAGGGHEGHDAHEGH